MKYLSLSFFLTLLLCAGPVRSQPTTAASDGGLDFGYQWVGVFVFEKQYARVVLRVDNVFESKPEVVWELLDGDGLKRGKSIVEADGVLNIGRYRVTNTKFIQRRRVIVTVDRDGQPADVENFRTNLDATPGYWGIPGSPTGYGILRRLPPGDWLPANGVTHGDQLETFGGVEVLRLIDESAGLIHARLLKPSESGPHRTVILIPGGPDPLPYKVDYFRIIAAALARDQVNSVIFDDRGVGESTGSKFATTYSESVEDIFRLIRALKTRPDVRPGGVILIGHSEGTLIAALAAARDRERGGGLVDGTILISPPSVEPISYLSSVFFSHEAAGHLNLTGQDEALTADFSKWLRAYASGTPQNMSFDSVASANPSLTPQLKREAEQWDNYAKLKLRVLERAKYDPIQLFPRAAATGKPLHIIFGQYDLNKNCAEPDRVQAALKDVSGAKTLTLPVTHDFLDNGPPDSDSAFDMTQVVSPRVYGELRRIVSEMP